MRLGRHIKVSGSFDVLKQWEESHLRTLEILLTHPNHSALGECPEIRGHQTCANNCENISLSKRPHSSFKMVLDRECKNLLSYILKHHGSWLSRGNIEGDAQSSMAFALASNPTGRGPAQERNLLSDTQCNRTLVSQVVA